MDIVALLQSLIAQLADLQLKLADAQSALDAEKAASYQLGVNDGVAQKQGELDAKQLELDAVKAELEELKKNPPVESDKIYSQAEADQLVVDAKAALKAELLQKYKEQQAVEAQGESEIEALLS